jgi:hypothetical protein
MVQMNYLHSFFFHGTKNPLYIGSDAIDFITWYQKGVENGTTLHTNLLHDIALRHPIEGIPETINKSMDGLFFRATIQYVADGAMKSYTAWINPDNILSAYHVQPDCMEVFFKSGLRLLVKGHISDLIKNILLHVRDYKERRKVAYGKSKS